MLRNNVRGQLTQRSRQPATSAIILEEVSCPADTAPLAQLDRASGYEPEGREFESLRAHHLFNDLGHRAKNPLGSCLRIVLQSYLTELLRRRNGYAVNHVIH
jgi:hypothetical protein